MDALDLHVEKGIWVDKHSHSFVNEMREGDLVGALDGAEALLQGRIAGVFRESNHGSLIIQHSSPANVAQELRKAPIGLHEPAAETDAVRLVYDPIRIKLVKHMENGPLHQVGVQRRNAIDAMRAHKCQVPHTHPSAAVFID